MRVHIDAIGGQRGEMSVRISTLAEIIERARVVRDTEGSVQPSSGAFYMLYEESVQLGTASTWLIDKRSRLETAVT